MNEAIFQRQIAREKRARAEAEKLLEDKSRELFRSNEKLLETSRFLEDQSKELTAILDHADMAVFLVDEGGIVRRANAAVVDVFSYTRGEFVGMVIDDAVTVSPSLSDFDLPIVQQTVTATNAGGESFQMEISIVDVSIDNENFALWLCRDVSRRVEAQAEKIRLEHELVQAQRLEALGVMASGIAHEINTPIQYVRDNVHFLSGAIEDLQRALSVHQSILEKLNASELVNTPAIARMKNDLSEIDLDFVLEEIPDALTHTAEGLKQISKIVGAVKSFSHPGSETTTPTDINALLEDTFTVTRNQWKYSADLELVLDPDVPEMSVYPSELNQVFMNLIVNAAHAIEESQQENGVIRAETRVEGGFVDILISDNGCGIPDEIVTKIFDPFFTTKDVGKGTGQGLSFCHQTITQHHKGQLTVSSEIGQHTTFRIRLPV